MDLLIQQFHHFRSLSKTQQQQRLQAHFVAFLPEAIYRSMKMEDYDTTREEVRRLCNLVQTDQLRYPAAASAPSA